MRFYFLGTGTSFGMPMIGCDCEVCHSPYIENKRLRTSGWLHVNDTDIIFDITPDFRLQALRANIKKIDAVLFTHEHADHTNGLDDIRIYNKIQKSHISIYGNKRTIEAIKRRFDYCFNPIQIGGGIPLIEPNIIIPYKKFKVKDIEILPLPSKHGKIEVMGYRIEDFAYFTDVSYFYEENYKYLKRLKVLVINALRYKPHPTHLNLEGALKVIEKINPSRAYLVHVCHKLEHFKVNSSLPSNVKIAFDNQIIEI